MYDHLKKLQKKHLKKASEVLTDSFIDNPMFVYFFPVPNKRRKILRSVFPMVLRILQTNGSLYVTSDSVEGLFCVSQQGEKTKVGKFMLAAISCAIRLPNVLVRLSLLDFLRKASRLHPANSKLSYYKQHYENFLMVDSVCVDPNHRHQGHMTNMMNAAVAETKKKRTFCLLQTETMQNVKIYTHLGFSLVEEIKSNQIPFSTYVMIYDPFGLTIK
ncbi:GNAT family N-acetyltransferase [Fictibacillus norfolkensis]|jgi:GNAT superfamily N-acetyltransferase|uniref:GNAT family N-acetyltransferase n=1 Tax=Fictibacillus norfolkensis TaxID=2762233 RepID=A0ABR8SJ25_9BACL|nr:GNAT family N-acetyltransferase [Fictibacillus norfolkensis]MBD7963491.1 GNAT family N-acetyltransferase [Fictibacillus norfolkensis]